MSLIVRELGLSHLFCLVEQAATWCLSVLLGPIPQGVVVFRIQACWKD
ncbi:hypothetical protein EES39_40680 [Streptomyces sp. ADI92-24]|nr:hypothetical protein [Streptomyces sp. ADI92-24]ROQ72578.1 hypothetical protein EDD95_5157 [Streptomyces sp. CEV 2-1]RPK29029.1 hypothetical protein EES39_40680 [Streptomyces sp. ADI92-24]